MYICLRRKTTIPHELLHKQMCFFSWTRLIIVTFETRDSFPGLPPNTSLLAVQARKRLEEESGQFPVSNL